MGQSRTSQISELLAQSWSIWNGPGDTEEEALKDFRRVKESAFDALMDFIGDLAVITVVEDESEGPKLYSVEDDRLYVVTIVQPGNGEESAEIEVAMHPIELEGASLTLQSRFVGQRTGPDPIRRKSKWTFRFRDGYELKLTTDSHERAPFDTISNADSLALLLAQELGWKKLP